MKLSDQEVKQFYRIWFPLLHFANKQLEVVPEFPHEWGEASVNIEDAAKIRDELWNNDSILTTFLEQNPYELQNEDLDIAHQWNVRITGSFFLYKYLKNYAVFLSDGEPDRAYGVLGITSTFEEMFGKYLPIYMKTTLLPFKDRIIYDSLLLPYPVSFGGGIKSSLNDTYRGIQEREGIIESLPFDAQNIDTDQVVRSNKKVLRAFEKYLGKSGLSPRKTIEHSENIAQFAHDFLADLTPPTFIVNIDKQLVDAYIQQSSKKVNLVSFRRFIRFLRDTYRLYYDDAEDILNFLKNK